MRYRVLRPFRDLDGSMRLPDESIELDGDRGAKLRSMGLVAIVVQQTPVIQADESASPETAPLRDMKKRDLNALAKDLGIDPRLKNKEQLVAEIEEAQTRVGEPAWARVYGQRELADLALEYEIDPEEKSREELIGAIEEREAARREAEGSAREGGEGDEGAPAEARG